MRYTNAESVPLDEIYFRLFPNATGGEMRVTNLTVNGRSTPTRLSYGDTALRVSLIAPLLPGDSAVIALDYVIIVP